MQEGLVGSWEGVILHHGLLYFYFFLEDLTLYYISVQKI